MSNIDRVVVLEHSRGYSRKTVVMINTLLSLIQKSNLFINSIIYNIININI